MVLLAIGGKTRHRAFRVRAGPETANEVANPWRAFLTSLAGTASNPLTIASWGAVFAAATTGADASPVPLVTGVGMIAFAGLLGVRTAQPATADQPAVP